MPTKLGQNFLRDKTVLDKIIRAADLKTDDSVLEVGPGEGVLTKELARLTRKVIAVETDEMLAKKTAAHFQFQISNDKSSNIKSNTEIIIDDILKINLPELLEKNGFNKYKIVANIPYYITSPIIRLFLETKYPPAEMVLLVQKEVAERICAPIGEMSILAVSVQYYAKPELLFTVPRTAFSPAPEVDSAVIRLTLFPARPKKDEAKRFFRIIRAGFSAKRKTLANNLASSLKLEKATVEEKLATIGVGPKQRAQELGLEDWKRLTKLL